MTGTLFGTPCAAAPLSTLLAFYAQHSTEAVRREAFTMLRHCPAMPPPSASSSTPSLLRRARSVPPPSKLASPFFRSWQVVGRVMRSVVVVIVMGVMVGSVMRSVVMGVI